MPDRKASFEREVEDYDPKALETAVNFAEHRFVSIERDKTTQHRYAKGHKTMRGACSYLAHAIESGEPYVPEFVLDLDQDARILLDEFAFVAPQSVDAVAVMMPREMAETVNICLKGQLNTPALEAPIKLIQQALDRRRER